MCESFLPLPCANLLDFPHAGQWSWIISAACSGGSGGFSWGLRRGWVVVSDSLRVGQDRTASPVLWWHHLCSRQPLPFVRGCSALHCTWLGLLSLDAITANPSSRLTCSSWCSSISLSMKSHFSPIHVSRLPAPSRGAVPSLPSPGAAS